MAERIQCGENRHRHAVTELTAGRRGGQGRRREGKMRKLKLRARLCREAARADNCRDQFEVSFFSLSSFFESQTEKSGCVLEGKHKVQVVI